MAKKKADHVWPDLSADEAYTMAGTLLKKREEALSLLLREWGGYVYGLANSNKHGPSETEEHGRIGRSDSDRETDNLIRMLNKEAAYYAAYFEGVAKSIRERNTKYANERKNLTQLVAEAEERKSQAFWFDKDPETFYKE